MEHQGTISHCLMSVFIGVKENESVSMTHLSCTPLYTYIERKFNKWKLSWQMCFHIVRIHLWHIWTEYELMTVCVRNHKTAGIFCLLWFSLDQFHSTTGCWAFHLKNCRILETSQQCFYLLFGSGCGHFLHDYTPFWTLQWPVQALVKCH